MKKHVETFVVILFLLVLTILDTGIVKAEQIVYITSYGGVKGTNMIRRYGDIYTFTGRIEANLVIQKGGVVVDGSGNTLQGAGTGTGVDLSNGRGQDPSRTQIRNVTVKNIQIVNFGIGINLVNSNNNSIIGNYISDCKHCGINMGGGDFLIKHNTIENIPGAELGSIAINFAFSGERIITENNFINPAIQFYLSSGTTFDRNYWKEYNVPDEDWDGIGDLSLIHISEPTRPY